METKRFPLTSILATRDATSTKDGILHNCYHESGPLGDSLIKRPGYSFAISLGIGCAQGAITYNGKAYFIQGDSTWLVTINEFGSVWTLSSGDPQSTNFGALVSLGDMFILGQTQGGQATVQSSDSGSTWTPITTPPWYIGYPRNNAVELGGLIFAPTQQFNFEPASQIEFYSSADGSSWTFLSSITVASLPLELVAHNGALFMFSGSSTVGDDAVYRSLDGITWTTVFSGTAWNSPVIGKVLSFNGNLYVIGTSSGSGGIFASANDGVSWSFLTLLPDVARTTFMQGWVVNGKMYLSGGQRSGDPDANDNVWSSDNGFTWDLVTDAPGWPARVGASSVSHNGTIYIGSGSDNFGDVLGMYQAVPSSAEEFQFDVPPTTGCDAFQLTLIPASGVIPVKVFIKNSENAYVFDGTSVVSVTDPDYPAVTVPGVVFLDGAIYVMDSQGIIYGSDLSDPLSWSALNFITANAEADEAIVLARQLNYIIAFKQSSIEVFYDAANAVGSPLGKVLNALMAVGCAHPLSLAFSDNTIYFIANAKQKGRSIMKMEGYTPRVISNPYIDRILNADRLTVVYAFVVKSNGHFFYVLTLGDSGLTLVLDETTSEWHVWTTQLVGLPASSVTAVVQDSGAILVTMPFPHGHSDGDPVEMTTGLPAAVNGSFNIRYNTTSHSTSQFSYFPDTAVVAVTASPNATFFEEQFFPGVYYSYGSGKDLLLDQTTGAVYIFDPITYQDNEAPINVKARMAILDFGTMATKRFNRLELVGDKEDTDVLVRFSDDDYQTWSLYRTIPMAQKRAKISSLGSARRRAFEFRHTGNTALRLLAAEIDYDQGAF